MATGTAPTLADIEEARRRLDGVARVTPVYSSENLSRLAGREVWLKAENLQRTGSFKIRGAVNRIGTLTPAECEAGVVAASAGNHAQAIAWAARESGTRATVFMPLDAPMAKVEATRNYGAEIELCGESFDDAMAAAKEHAAETGATFVHAFEDGRVIAGQGTLGLELAEQLPDVETVLVPIGGGGLCAGIALALRGVGHRARVVGVQAAAIAPFAGSETHGLTIADGIAVKEPGDYTRTLLRDLVDDVVTATEEEISHAIVLLSERTKLVVEGAGAVGVGALLARRVPGTGPVACVLSGGNIDAATLIAVLRHGLALAGRYLRVRTRVPDRPGQLAKLLELVAAERVNVISVQHHREGLEVPIGATEILLTLVARDEEHAEELVETIRRWGYDLERVR